MKRVSVFMDVEDPINPLADEAALDLATLFTEAGIRGSFCITGEKCRTLEARRRFDVIEALEPHCLGLHTNTHSYHPTTMELLSDVTYADGCEAAFEAERPGFDAFESVFRRKPVFWGGAGNSWSPEIADALKRLDIPACVYALTALPDEGFHRFNGILALPQAASVSDDEWADDNLAAEAIARILKEVATIPQPWIGIYVGHPTRLRHVEFWDVPFYAGRTPPQPELIEPQPAAIYERSKRNLRGFLAELPRQAEVIGVDEALALPWQFRPLGYEETAFFRRETAENLRSVLGWPIHRPDLSAEGIIAKTLALADTVEAAFL